jgi:hypothetical protein
MVRALARAYYYVVFLALLVFAASGLGVLLAVLLRLTPLRGGETAPTGRDVTQAVIYAVVAWLIAGALGGLHYWLIRRDIETEPAAGRGPLRSFFLNFGEAAAVLNAVPAAAFAVESIGGFFSTGLLAYALAALAVAAVLEWERRRTPVDPGAALTFQRLHVYGVQLVLLFLAADFWMTALNSTFAGILRSAALLPACDAQVYPNPGCFGRLPAASWAAGLLVALAWGAYYVLARNDSRSTLRAIGQMLGFAFGIIVAAFGVYGALRALWLVVLRSSLTWADFADAGSVGALLFGLFAAAVYAWWLRSERDNSVLGADEVDLSLLAVVAGVLAAPLWWGVGNLLYQALESLSPTTPDAAAWAHCLALLLTGVASVPLMWYLWRRTAQTDLRTPLRALLFVTLGAGIVAVAIGGATALYTLVTALLQVAVDNWPEVMRTAVSALLVGAVVAGLAFWLGRRDGLLTLPALRPMASPAPADHEATHAVSAQAEAEVRAIVDDLLAGTLTREEAIARLSHVAERAHVTDRP